MEEFDGTCRCLLMFSFEFLFYVYECFFCLHVCYAPLVCSADGGQRGQQVHWDWNCRLL